MFEFEHSSYQQLIFFTSKSSNYKMKRVAHVAPVFPKSSVKQ